MQVSSSGGDDIESLPPQAFVKSILPIMGGGGADAMTTSPPSSSPLPSSSPTKLQTPVQNVNNDYTMNNDTIKISSEKNLIDINDNDNDNDEKLTNVNDETNLDVVDFIEVNNDCINVDQEDFW